MVRPEDIAVAVEALRAGEIIGLPTETVYGLAGDASNAAAIARIYAIKGRPATHPVIVHLADATHLERWAREVPPAARALADAFWPGPLTLVLPKQPWVLPAVTGGQDTVALRVPAHPLARAVLHAFGGGLAAPSANLPSGKGARPRRPISHLPRRPIGVRGPRAWQHGKVACQYSRQKALRLAVSACQGLRAPTTLPAHARASRRPL